MKVVYLERVETNFVLPAFPIFSRYVYAPRFDILLGSNMPEGSGGFSLVDDGDIRREVISVARSKKPKTSCWGTYQNIAEVEDCDSYMLKLAGDAKKHEELKKEIEGGMGHILGLFESAKPKTKPRKPYKLEREKK